MKKVVTLGEIMLRLSPPGVERFLQANRFDLVFGGSEANVAVSLANYGIGSYYVTKLPVHEVGQCAVNDLRRLGVNTCYILRGGNRVGIYYMEYGASMRPSNVIYDRKGSAISEAEPDEFDFEKIFEGAHWFHFSGITPALSSNAAKLTEKAVKTAKKMGLTVSVDLNYRKKLWTKEQARRCMTPLMHYTDVCIGNEEDAEDVLGFKPEGVDVSKGILSIEGYHSICRQMNKEFGFKYTALTLRESYSASDNGWSAIIYDGNELYRSKKYDIRLVDRLGGGDAFAGGLIYGLLELSDFKKAVEFAAAASALKQTIFGDYNLANINEVNALMENGGSGRIKR